MLFHKALHLRVFHVPNAEFPYNWSLRSCTVHTPKIDNGTKSTEYRRSRKGYCLASGWQYAKKCCCETWCHSVSLADFGNGSKQRILFEIVHVREDPEVTNMTLRQHTTTARRLRDNLQTATGTRVSDQTIRNRLRANNLRCRRQAVQPPLLPRHRTARRHCCTLHLRWQRVQWGRVMFTDESRFSIQFNDSRVRVYRCPGERFADVNDRQRHRFGGGSVMVWGSISIHHRTPPSMWWMAI